MEVSTSYPYRSTRERDCVRVHIQQDFCFKGSRPLFGQVLIQPAEKCAARAGLGQQRTQPRRLRHRCGSAPRQRPHRGVRRRRGHCPRATAPGLRTLLFHPVGAGSGLGLTFCKNVVEAAGGTLSVHSEPNAGAVFMIDLPLKC
jgi:two-component system, CAI-1 autoinducer sensor kinase/phosphatase CqsS